MMYLHHFVDQPQALNNRPNENLLIFYRKQPGCNAKQQLVKLTAEAASSWDTQTLTL